MTRTLLLTNHKGDVGTSTSATNSAFGFVNVLRSAGAPNSRVLLVDTDSQGHATLVTTGSKDYGTHNSLYTVLTAILAIHANGMSYRQIARKVGLYWTRIQEIVKSADQV